jgi:hypothetical protein
MLDTLAAELGELRCAVGATDRPKLEAHLESLRDLEKSLSVTISASCQRPALGPPPPESAMKIPTLIRQQLDIIVAALACDVTRVITMQFGNGAGGLATYRWLGVPGNHHSISHNGDGITAAQRDERLTRIETWQAQQFAYLVDKLDRTPAEGKTLLDRTATLWAHEQSNGATHQRRDMPFVMAGGLDGVFQTGRVIDFGGKPHSGLLISLANGMGVPTASFGDPDFSRGPLAGL